MVLIRNIIKWPRLREQTSFLGHFCIINSEMMICVKIRNINAIDANGARGQA